MSQGDILKILQRNKYSWFTLDYLKNKYNLTGVSEGLLKMYKFGEIDRIELTLNGKRRYLIRIKIKGRDINDY